MAPALTCTVSFLLFHRTPNIFVTYNCAQHSGATEDDSKAAMHKTEAKTNDVKEANAATIAIVKEEVSANIMDHNINKK
jgi:hypothetical protein